MVETIIVAHIENNSRKFQNFNRDLKIPVVYRGNVPGKAIGMCGLSSMCCQRRREPATGISKYFLS